MRQLQETFGRMARDNGFSIQADASGNVAFIPLQGDRPMTPEELERLSEEQRQDLERRQNQIVQEFRSVMLRQRQLMQQLTAEIREVERNFSAMLIAPLIAELKQRHPQEPRAALSRCRPGSICWPTSSGSKKGAHRHPQGAALFAATQ